MEVLFPEEFQIVASLPMAGAYDLSGTMIDLILSMEPYSQAFYFAFILLAYIEYYQLDELNEFFTEYYADILPDLFDDTHSGRYINNFLPSVAINILNLEVLEEFINDENHPFRQIAQANDLYNWMPLTELHMFHGLADELVLFSNSQITYDSFLVLKMSTWKQSPNGMEVIAVLQSPVYLELIL